MLRSLLFAILLIFGVPASVSVSSAVPDLDGLDLENMLFLDLEYGRVIILMRPDKAPNHVARVKQLVRQGFYDGLIFHRVIEGFMAQTGDPLGNGTGGSGQNLEAEFNTLWHVRGTVSMARGGHDINSADSQFFIMFQPKRSLNGNYTAWGRVIGGMEYVDQIERGEPPLNPSRIIKIQVAADAQSAGASE